VPSSVASACSAGAALQTTSTALCDGLGRDASSLWAELADAGRAEVDERGHLAPLTYPEGGAVEASEATTGDRLAAQSVLEAIADPMSLLRAALIMAEGADWDRAEVTIMRALAVARERGSRTVILESWSRAVQASSASDADARGDAIASRLLRSADVALRHGIPELAQTLARRALALGASALEGRIIEARAAMENGDLSAASAAFDLGARAAGSASDRARLDAHLAELSILRGQLDDALTRATSALELAAGEQVRLVARNVLGKILLARGEWARAEQHFAADESAACGAGEPEAELRARLNRAVALLSTGRRDEAVVVLETVERDATQRGMHRAAAFAQANLATAATLAHDYGGALSRWESAIAAVRAAGDRPKLARLIANLAELRVRLGLLTEAEEALAFGRRACRAGLSQPLASLLSFVAAKLRLAQGRTLLAATEIEAALAAASASSNGAKLGECHRLAARIAFEDGDLGRAAASLEAARSAAGGPDAETELALLDGMIRRGRGEPFEAFARRAVELAHQTGDPELARQAHLLSFHAASERGDWSLATSHLTQAKRLRDEMAASLPDALRARFLARPELALLDTLEAASSSGRAFERGRRAGLGSPRSAFEREAVCPACAGHGW
jgi:tetratricopeptide (TPR) repeat protein